MKVGFIPPVPELHRYGLGVGNFALLLSHLVDEFPGYAKFYKEQRIHNDTFLCLDNSAHEDGKGHDPEKLWMQAHLLHAQEIVAPDELDSWHGTCERSTEAIQLWGSFPKHPTVKSIMVVPQGQDALEWYHCLCNLIELHNDYLSGRYDLVVGLSKDYEVWPGGLLHLIEEYLNPMRWKHGFDVHLLGWGRNLWALAEIGKIHRWIRSTDSAKPFVYALHDIEIDPQADPPQYPKRPKDYFTRQFGETQVEIANWNAKTFLAASRGIR